MPCCGSSRPPSCPREGWRGNPHSGSNSWSKGPVGNNLPDFSYAGYACGEKPIPDAPQVAVATDFGAVPNDEGDDTAALQKAIDAVAAKGGGALLIPAGRYYINSNLAGEGSGIQKAGFLHIRTSNVVLRGAGSGPQGDHPPPS